MNLEDGGDQCCISMLYLEHANEPENSVCKSREVVPGFLYPKSILGLSLPQTVKKEFIKLYEHILFGSNPGSAIDLLVVFLIWFGLNF